MVVLLGLLEDGHQLGNGDGHLVGVGLLDQSEVAGGLALLSALGGGLEEVFLILELGEEGVGLVCLSLGGERGVLSTPSGGGLRHGGDLAALVEHDAVQEVVRDDQTTTVGSDFDQSSFFAEETRS